MRRLRVSAPTQLPLVLPDQPADQLWGSLPETVRATVLVLLARLIARGVIIEEADE